MANSDAFRNEEGLYALWERRAEPGLCFSCAHGQRVVVVAPGRRNPGAGPDYLGAVLIVDGDLQTGAVEMHMREADWFAHAHDADPAYDAVILHVLAEPAEGRLRLPTVCADVLAVQETAGEATWPPAHGEAHGPALDAVTIAELSWARLLRRATEILRGESARAPQDRIRRAFVRRLYDCLGYAANRGPMVALAEALLAREETLRVADFDAMAAMIFGFAGLPAERVMECGRGFMSERRLRNIVENTDLPRACVGWRFNTRPANAPERRVWGALKLTFDLYRSDLFTRCFAILGRPDEAAAVDRVAALLCVRMGSQAFVGIARAREIVINALLPAALAAGIAFERGVVAGACTAYRLAPSLESNAIVRSVERAYGGRRLVGAFWQQGAIEFHQRYRSTDRGRLSFVADRD